ncbi:MAG: patatin family protein [Hespellia sp.]|nr:patatin family protein [Hespellia sp.]
MEKATIVLEGGATRGVFTAGALDYLMEKDVFFSDVIGVSAGACNAVDYVSKQIGRTRDCMIHSEKELNYYYGIRKGLKEKSLMNMDMVFDKYPNELIPFDYDTFFASESRCEIVTTNCDNGKAEYMSEYEDGAKLLKMTRASSSMPLICPMVEIDGIPYLDGGLADSIPIGRAMEYGNEKVVVILTQNPGYRKSRPSKPMEHLFRHAYKTRPQLVRTILRRSFVYNETIKRIHELEQEGKIFVLRPQIPVVSRLERNTDTLMNFYNHGYQLMEKEYDNLMKYLTR